LVWRSYYEYPMRSTATTFRRRTACANTYEPVLVFYGEGYRDITVTPARGRGRSPENRPSLSPHRHVTTTDSRAEAAIKVDKYDCSSYIETYLLKFEYIARYNKWRDCDRAAHPAAALTGSAGLILWNLPEPSYDELASGLRQRYGSSQQQEKFRYAVRARHRKRTRVCKNWQKMWNA
jgi:hypothetical protein